MPDHIIFPAATLALVLIIIWTTLALLRRFCPDAPDPEYRWRVIVDFSPFLLDTKVIYRCNRWRAYRTARLHVKRFPYGKALVQQRPHPMETA
jgi:hypothetical protein